MSPIQFKSLQSAISKVNYDNIDPELQKYLTGYAQIDSQKWYIPKKLRNKKINVYNFEVRSSDVWIIGYPKAGTSVLQELVWLLKNNSKCEETSEEITKKISYYDQKSLVKDIHKVSPIEEHIQNLGRNVSRPVYEVLSETNGRRFIKSYLPISLLPPDLLTSGCKIIYLARNPKDLAVLNYVETDNKLVNFTEHWESFQKGLICWTSFFEHLKEAWEHRNNKNFLFIFYEELHKHFEKNIKNISTFLDLSYDFINLHSLEKHFNNDRHKNKVIYKKCAKNIGKKQIHSYLNKKKLWKNCFDDDLNKKADKWIEESLEKNRIELPVIFF